MGVITKTAAANYHVTQATSKDSGSAYHVLPPVVEVYDGLNQYLLDSLDIGLIASGTTAPEFLLYIWNDKTGGEALKMDSVVVTVSLSDGAYTGGTDAAGQEAVDEKWFEIKSSGVMGDDITDDEQSAFTPVGGDPSTGGLSIGEIPTDAARILHCRLNVPAQVSTSYNANPRLEIGFNAVPHPGFGKSHGEYFGG